MKTNDISKYTGINTLTVSEAMQLIDLNACGIIFLTSESGVLEACVTDGDIRRFLLSGGSMTEPAIKAANKNPKTAKSFEEAKTIYHKKDFVLIPVVNSDGKICGFYDGDGTKEKQREALHIPVVINAGGKGTRLDPYTKVLPKPLIPIGEIPIIEHIMKEFKSYSCEEFHIIVNYKKELIKAYFSDMTDEYNIRWYDEGKPLGTGGGLSLLNGIFDSTFFFVNCDALLTADYAGMIDFHKKHNNLITMICAYKNINIPYGVVEIGVNGKIESMKEKPLMSFLTNTGIYIVEPEVTEDIEPDSFIGFPDIIEMEKKKGKQVAVFPVSENDWMDMGQLPELEKMRVRLYGE